MKWAKQRTESGVGATQCEALYKHLLNGQSRPTLYSQRPQTYNEFHASRPLHLWRACRSQACSEGIIILAYSRHMEVKSHGFTYTGLIAGSGLEFQQGNARNQNKAETEQGGVKAGFGTTSLGHGSPVRKNAGTLQCSRFTTAISLHRWFFPLPCSTSNPILILPQKTYRECKTLPGKYCAPNVWMDFIFLH